MDEWVVLEVGVSAKRKILWNSVKGLRTAAS